VVNVPLPEGADGEMFRAALETAVLPRIAAFESDLILVSAGFDDHWRDPLAGLDLTEDDFRWATERLVDVADRVCSGRVVSLLEGGYDLIGLARSAAAHVEALIEPLLHCTAQATEASTVAA
jgi:acetoin utilization deacetylase AcuC-like enzyme